MQNLSVFGSDLILSVITEVETCVFKPWVASSFLEGLGVTRIALFSSQAENMNVSIRFQTRQTIANKAMSPSAPGRGGGGRAYRSQNEEKGGTESEFWIHV